MIVCHGTKELYRLGGRTFLVLNMAPVGCYPSFLVEVAHNKTDLDALGCLIPYNNVVNEYNSMLKETLNETRQSLPKASLIYVDTHSILLELFQHPTSHGTRSLKIRLMSFQKRVFILIFCFHFQFLELLR